MLPCVESDKSNTTKEAWSIYVTQSIRLPFGTNEYRTVDRWIGGVNTKLLTRSILLSRTKPVTERTA